MSEASVFKGGLPYGPEIRRLNEAFPVPELQEGRFLSHEILEVNLQLKRGLQRYYGIINSWISRQRNENGIHIAWEPGRGLKVLKPDELLASTETKIRSKGRQLGRAVNHLKWVDRSRLDETGQRRLDNDLLVSTRLRQALDQSRKELAVELSPVKSLPKPKLVKAS